MRISEYINHRLIREDKCAHKCLNLFFALCAILISFFPNKLLAAPLENLSINGYLSFEYEKNIGGDQQGDLNGSFDADLFDLVFNFRATEHLRIAADITWEHGAATEDNRGNAAIEYAFGEYTIKELYKVRVGKMFTNFGIYNEIHTAKPATLTVKEPLSTNKNNSFGSNVRFYPRWLTGLALTGRGEMGESEFDYIVQISNGESNNSSVNPYEEDDNKNKAISGRIRISPNDQIRYGFSFYSEDTGPNNSSISYKLDSLGAQLEWELDNALNIEIELVSGSEKAVGGANIDRFAYTAMFSYPVNDWLTPYLRLEYLEPNKDIDNDEASLSIIGLNMMIDTNLYLKIEVDKISTETNNAKYSGADFTEFKASVSIGF